MKALFTIIFLSGVVNIRAQKIDSLYFNLYTDSLKKGVYNYINVDGKTSEGSFVPLTAEELKFSSNVGKWDGNSIILDSSTQAEKVIITASLKVQLQIKKSIIIYIKKVDTPGELKTEEEVINGYLKRKQRG